MKEKFLNKKVDYFWEYDYSFMNDFLKNIFGEKARRKYSLSGNGIYNLIDGEDGRTYELKLTKARAMVNENSSLSRNSYQNEIMKKLIENINTDNYSVSKNKILTFKLNNDIMKIEIVRKLKEPI